MKSDRVIESAIRAAQNLLWQNLPPTHKLPDAAAVARLRDLVRSPAVKSALLHSNDTFLAFVLRAVEFVLADQFRADREIIDAKEFSPQLPDGEPRRESNTPGLSIVLPSMIDGSALTALLVLCDECQPT